MKELRDGPITGESGEPYADLEKLWATISENQRWVPQGAALGFTAEASTALGSSVRSAFLVGLCVHAVQLESPQLGTLQDQLVAELGRLQLNGIALWAEFRDAATATELFDQLRGQADAMRSQGMTVEELPNGIEVSAKVFDLVPSGLLPNILVQLGLTSGPDDPKLPLLTEAIGRLGATARIERKGSAIGLRVGSPPATTAPALAASDQLGSRFTRAPPTTAMWGRWDVEPLRGEARTWNQLLDTWLNTPIGRRLVASDEEDLLSDLRDTAQTILEAGNRGEVLVDAASPVRVETWEWGMPDAERLSAGHPLATRVPDTPAAAVNNIASLADYFIAVLANFEERLARNWLKNNILGKETEAEVIDRISSTYYTKFADLRTKIKKESREIFVPGSAYVVASDSTLDRFRLQIGGTEVAAGEGLPLVQIAMIGKVNDEARALTFTAKLYTELVTAFAEVSGVPAPASEGWMKSSNMGLPIPVQEFTAPWLAAMTGGSVKLELAGDLRPHMFTIDGYFVFSTSPALSRRILDKTAPRLKLPAVGESAGDPIAYGRISGSLFTTLTNTTAAWLKVLDEEAAADLTVGVPSLNRMLALIDRMQWHTRIDSGVQHSVFEVVFAK